MGSIYELIICLIFAIAGIWNIIKYIRVFLSHPAEVEATIVNVDELGSNEDDPFSICLQYKYLSKSYTTNTTTFTFFKPQIGETIIARVNPQKPDDCIYCGKNNRYFFIRITTYLIFVIVLIVIGLFNV